METNKSQSVKKRKARLLVHQKLAPTNKPEEISFADGTFKSSKQPNFKYIPYHSLVRLAARFDLGIERKKGAAWNALSKNQSALVDLEVVIERCSHAAHHAMKLKAILAGEIPDDGDDHAAAIMWSGSFLCEATRSLDRDPSSRVK